MVEIDLTFLQSNQTLIPFLFVLAVIFGILEITHVFRNRGVNFLIALAISFFSVTNASFVAFLWSQFGNITVFFIVMFFIAFLLEVFGLRRPVPGKSRSEEAMIIVGVFLLLIMIFGFMYAKSIPELPIIGSGTNFVILAAIIFILILFWIAFKAGPETVKAEAGKRE